MKRVAAIHTAFFVAQMFKGRFEKSFPNLSFFHMVDESLLNELLSEGRLTSGVKRRLCNMAFNAKDAGADLIVFTCSSTSPAVDVVRELLDIPVLKIDDPMAEKAVKLGRRIGVICSAVTAGEAAKLLLRGHSERLSKPVDIKIALVTDAFSAIQRGDRELHDELITKEALKLSSDVDVLVLAQLSMSHLGAKLDQMVCVPVLNSLDACMEHLSQFFASDDPGEKAV
ncbi:aspartate/glutamate racemase family protein [Thermodesulforhabdus norvegica]|uniref:Asp/Glu/Hydantoin racemase n=1 Tax=Thermodesulforhabdus norvegica TaxID=39841 RepID=A0A1I4R2V0_9BACT|nr:aspartate/glutamate racemase family protein [Thermodesulforhabdus norvegica]SFM46654.1 Asp/Glu/Hydantoin racemase [Thermodesulforhabdus norvegica]